MHRHGASKRGSTVSGGGGTPGGGGGTSTRSKWIIGAIVVPIVGALIAALATLATGAGDETTTKCSGSAQCGDGNNRVEK